MYDSATSRLSRLFRLAWNCVYVALYTIDPRRIELSILPLVDQPGNIYDLVARKTDGLLLLLLRCFSYLRWTLEDLPAHLVYASLLCVLTTVRFFLFSFLVLFFFFFQSYFYFPFFFRLRYTRLSMEKCLSRGSSACLRGLFHCGVIPSRLPSIN